jgi:hypothetical protein
MPSIARFLSDGSQWLLAALLVVIGCMALVAAPSPFVQHVHAVDGGCNSENPCGEDQFCCDGACSDCPCDEAL